LDHMEPSATSTMVTGPVGERLQVGTEDAPVLDRLAPLRCLHDSGAGYPDVLTYLVKCTPIAGEGIGAGVGLHGHLVEGGLGYLTQIQCLGRGF